MKEIQKEIQEVRYVTLYEAADGETFHSKEECEKYENSAAFVLLDKIKKFKIDAEIDRNEYDFLDCNEDNDYIVAVPRTQEDIDTLNQLWFMHGGKNCEAGKFDAKDINTPILVGSRIYGNEIEWAWFYKIKDMISAFCGGLFELISIKHVKTKED